jgi:hypothetical protein
LCENSILYFEEVIAGKRQKMKYKVTKVSEQDAIATIHLKAMFLRSLLNIRAQFTITFVRGRVEFHRTLMLGTTTIFVGWLLDKLAFLLGRTYLEAIKEHESRDLYQLKQFLETQYTETM